MRTDTEKTAPNKEIKTKKRIFSKLGYTKLETAELVNAMNHLLASYNVHYQKLRNFHWNVKGGDFFDIHQQFELQYQEARKSIDDIAERIRIFGMEPFSTMGEYLEYSEIQEAGYGLKALEMVEEILRDYRVLLEQLFNVVELAIENGDSGTEDMMKDIIRYLEKNHWMMTAFSTRE